MSKLLLHQQEAMELIRVVYSGSYSFKCAFNAICRVDEVICSFHHLFFSSPVNSKAWMWPSQPCPLKLIVEPSSLIYWMKSTSAISCCTARLLIRLLVVSSFFPHRWLHPVLPFNGLRDFFLSSFNGLLELDIFLSLFLSLYLFIYLYFSFFTFPLCGPENVNRI